MLCCVIFRYIEYVLYGLFYPFGFWLVSLVPLFRHAPKAIHYANIVTLIPSCQKFLLNSTWTYNCLNIRTPVNVVVWHLLLQWYSLRFWVHGSYFGPWCGMPCRFVCHVGIWYKYGWSPLSSQMSLRTEKGKLFWIYYFSRKANREEKLAVFVC